MTVLAVNMLRRPVILIGVRVGNFVRKDVGLRFLDRWHWNVWRHSGREIWVGWSRDRFGRHHHGLLFRRATDGALGLFQDAVAA